MSVDKDNSELEYEIGGDETATDVEVKDASDDQDQDQDQGQEQQSAHSSELDSVSDAVQKRISKLTARMREAERREQAALEYARGVQTQQQSLQQRLMQSDYQRMNETKNRIDTQMVALRQIIKKAREEGDIDTETEAQSRLTDLAVEGRQIAGMLQQSGNAPQQGQTQQTQTQHQQPQQSYQQTQQPQQKAAPKPSPRAQKWAEDNEWFGKDRVMTYVAWGIHQSLIEQEGIDPESEEYYTELDNRLRKEIPHKFQASQSPQNRQQRSAPAVAPASRGQAGVNSQARRQVRLKPSQVAIAKKLGVPLEEYAKYVKE
jgi:hypothetical protein